jgi:V/A-type H+/Na+-transporting ATPase subunit I
MSLRSGTARWFELLTSREELGAALDCLAQTRSVQLQAYSRAESRLPLGDLKRVLDEFESLARRYRPWWPAAQPCKVDAEHALLDAPQAALERLRGWAIAAEPWVAELETLARERVELQSLERLCVAADVALPRLDRLAAAGPVLASRVYVLPPGTPALSLPPALIHQVWEPEATGESYLLAIGPSEDVNELDAALAARKVHRIVLPADLPHEIGELHANLQQRRGALESREGIARAGLARLDAEHRIAAALGEIALAAWVVAHVPELPVTEHFAWITGWCADKDDCGLHDALDARGLHYLLRMTEAPAGSIAPSILRNPRWARPFETVTGMMGTPAAGDADPSLLVAILAPLMFGFMFGDVVQGAIVALIGLALGRRIPAVRLLVPGGLMAIAFGFAFGSVFAREDVIPALWLHPLAQPLPVLGVALAFGVATLVLGLVLDALQSHWHGRLRRWLLCDSGLLLAYVGLVAAVIDLRALWLLPLGIAWTLAGSALAQPTGRLTAVGAAAGAFVERLLQLGVNTVSFVRVGAFALAHAGLCSAVVGMAEAAGPGYWPVLLIGNAAIIALEGLVVSIQTTRLVLFEFFIRFLTARGRPFEPLTPPPASLPGGTP